MTTSYTNEMSKLAIYAAVAAALIVLLLPTGARAKSVGDHIGAPTREPVTITSRTDISDAPVAPVSVYDAATTTEATSTPPDAEYARIKTLLEEVVRLLTILNALQA